MWPLVARLLKIAVAFLLSCLAASVVMTAAILSQAWILGAVPFSLRDLLQSIGPAVTIVPGVFAVTALLSIVPASLVVLIAEVRGVRSPVFYAIAGAATGLIGQVLLALGIFLLWRKFGQRLSIQPSYVTAIAAAAGGIGGISYWRLAGREAGMGRTRGVAS